jgi:hypothetical protein
LQNICTERFVFPNSLSLGALMDLNLGKLLSAILKELKDLLRFRVRRVDNPLVFQAVEEISFETALHHHSFRIKQDCVAEGFAGLLVPRH